MRSASAAGTRAERSAAQAVSVVIVLIDISPSFGERYHLNGDICMQTLGMVSLVVRDYDEALAFYVGKLGFTLIEDSFVPEQNKRWVVIEPPGAAGGGAKLLLARGVNESQNSR